MTTNYTTEQVSYMIDKYEEAPTRETVEMLANELGKSTKSIIGKLSREGVYQKAIYVSKTGEIPVTKKELVVKLSEALDGDLEQLEGLEKSPKQELKYLLSLVE
jgi:Zn-dependent M32 family carboxypeptidase|tara:strand:+ start:1064 stop:1375 length:312 start_codon:yes stop_codon:yes gene_type:complete